MSTFAALGVYNRTDDWVIAGIFLVASYIIIYPLYIIYLRMRYTRRIKNQLVTSAYKLPVDMAPVELSYIFSTRVSENQIYATLLDLTNRSVLLMKADEGKVVVTMGPKVDNKLKPFEKILINQIESSDEPVHLKRLTSGMTRYHESSDERIDGSKQYVFWWLIRNTLRKRKIIEKHMTGRYIRMLFNHAVISGLLISTIPLVLIRLFQLLDSGEVDLNRIVQTAGSGLFLWLLALPVLIVVSFFLLRFKGRMLGRSWLITGSFRRYLGQLDAFREFVRLTHRNKLRFESKELRKESLNSTRPYAIACGFVNK